MMLPPTRHSDRKDGGSGLVALAIDKDKNSQNALKWAIDNILQRGQTVILIHVKLIPPPFSSSPYLNVHSAFEGMYSYEFQRSSQSSDSSDHNSLGAKEPDAESKVLFLPFRCFCTRKNIQCKDIVLEDTDVAKALTEYVTQMAIANLVIGAATKAGFLRFKITDVPGSVLKGAPDFCTVYVISKEKIASTRSASRPAPSISPLHQQVLSSRVRPTRSDNQTPQAPSIRGAERPPLELPRKSSDESDFFSPSGAGDLFTGINE